METKVQSRTLAEIAALVGGELSGPADLRIERLAPSGCGDANSITFAQDAAYLERVERSEVGAVLIGPESSTTKHCVRVKSPRKAFGLLLAAWDRPVTIEAGVHQTAIVHHESVVDPSASIGAYSVIERGATIGKDCRVFAHAYIGERCRLESGCAVYPHAVLYRDVWLGAGATVHAGAVLGKDGFGFAWDGDRHARVPQVGSVAISADVEIGANSCVDRATAGETKIGEGVKIDNLVQVAHNVDIGPRCVLASQVGLSGSVTLGENVVCGGQVGVADHRVVTNQVKLGGRAGVIQDVTEPGEYSGLPALPAKEWLRLMALTRRLPALLRRIKLLEEEIELLKNR